MLDNIWFVPRKSRELVSPYELLPSSTLIQAAQPFTVSLVTAVVAEDLDGWLRGTRILFGDEHYIDG